MTPQTRANDHYLLQRVTGSGPEQMIALLLEGAQRFLSQAAQAVGKKDYEAKARTLDKVLAILQELELRLDLEHGGELAQNLAGLYQWWGRELLAAGGTLDSGRLESISVQMGEIRQAWELAYRQRMECQSSVGLPIGDMVG